MESLLAFVPDVICFGSNWSSALQPASICKATGVVDDFFVFLDSLCQSNLPLTFFGTIGHTSDVCKWV